MRRRKVRIYPYSSVVVYVTFLTVKLIVDKFGKLMYNVCSAKLNFATKHGSPKRLYFGCFLQVTN